MLFVHTMFEATFHKILKIQASTKTNLRSNIWIPHSKMKPVPIYLYHGPFLFQKVEDHKAHQ